MPRLGVQIVHRLPTRIRLRAGAIVGQPAAGRRIATALAREPGIERVGVRPTTGSVVVEGRQGALDPEPVARRLSELISEEHDEAGRPLGEATSVDFRATRLAKAVADAMRAVNASVREALHGEADLGTLTPAFFTIASLIEISVTGELPAPSWSTLLWYSLRSFVVFNPEVTDDAAGESGDD